MRNIGGLSLGVVCLLVALVVAGGLASLAVTLRRPRLLHHQHKRSASCLGDSDATGTGDPTGQGWVGRYAALVHKVTGSPVHVTNLARDGKTSDVLLTEVVGPGDATSLWGAQVVLLGIGGADLNQGDDDLQLGKCKGRACYTPLLRQFGRNFDATVGTVRQLAGRFALIRAISVRNGIPAPEARFRRSSPQVFLSTRRSPKEPSSAIRCGSTEETALT